MPPRPATLSSVDLTPYIPQLITAVASLGGVLIGLLINGQRESRRFDKQIAFEREKILADQRRELFVKTAQALQRTTETLKMAETVQTEPERGIWRSAVKSRTDELFMLETEVRLLAPQLMSPVRAAVRRARAIRDAPDSADTDTVSGYFLEFMVSVEDAMAVMRTVMGTDTAGDRRTASALAKRSAS